MAGMIPPLPIKGARRPRQSAFSLVEMLAAIAILGIMASIVVTAFGRPQRMVFLDAERRQNAASLAAMANCVQIAGTEIVVPGNLAATVKRLRDGTVIKAGALRGNCFKVSGITDEELPGVLYYLEIRNNELVYRADRSMPPD